MTPHMLFISLALAISLASLVINLCTVIFMRRSYRRLKDQQARTIKDAEAEAARRREKAIAVTRATIAQYAEQGALRS